MPVDARDSPRPPRKTVRAAAVVCMIASLGFLSVVTNEPFLFASAGPTAMIVANNPFKRETAYPSILAGHAFAVAAGVLSLLLFGLYDASLAPFDTSEPLTWTHLAAASVAMGATAFFSEKSPFPHPPSAATTLLVSLGIMSGAIELAFLMAGVATIAAISVLYRWLITSGHIS